MARRQKQAWNNPTQIVETFTVGLEHILANYADHWRLSVFLHKGLACANPSCDRVGDRIVYWYDYGWERLEGAVLSRGLHIDVIAGSTLMTVDHKKPKSKGGTNDLENLVPMCSPCNQKKADKLHEEEDVGGSTQSQTSIMG
jgi:5-methylcytosine-specific restriction endonuclease McrA